MKKISKLTVRDFRTFKNKKVFQLRTSSNDIADLVVIYAPNGIGKTSFFDAIEWGVSGHVNRLDKSIKNKNYEGYILKNRDSNSENTEVEIEFNDDSIISRKTNRLNKQDYNKGKFFGDPNIKNFGDWDSIILSHDRIDGFISALSPSDRYKAWLPFWDENNKVTNIFKELGLAMKECNEKIEKVKMEIKDANENLVKLQIPQETIVRFNKIIWDTNVFLGSSFSEVGGSGNSDSLYDILLDVDSNLNNNLREVNEEIARSRQLINNIEKYFDDIRNHQYIENLVRQWEKVVLLVIKKEKIIENIKSLEDLFELNSKAKKNYDRLIEYGQEWYAEFKDYEQNKRLLVMNKTQIESTKKYKNTVDELNESISSNIEEIIVQIKTLNEKYSKRIIIEENYKKEKNKLLEKEKRIEKLEKIIIKRKADEEKSLIKLKKLENLSVTSEVFIGEDELDRIRELAIKLEFENIELFNELRKVIKRKVNIEIILDKNRLRLSKEIELSNTIGSLINSGREIIERYKLESCPLCKSEFLNFDELLQVTLSYDSSTKLLKSINEAITENKEQLNGVTREYNELIMNWNEYIDNKIEMNKKAMELLKVKSEKTNIRLEVAKEIRVLIKNNLVSLENLRNQIDSAYKGANIENILNKMEKHQDDMKKTIAIDQERIKNNGQELASINKNINELIEMNEKLLYKIKNFESDPCHPINADLLNIIEEEVSWIDLGISKQATEIEVQRIEAKLKLLKNKLNKCPSVKPEAIQRYSANIVNLKGELTSLTDSIKRYEQKYCEIVNSNKVENEILEVYIEKQSNDLLVNELLLERIEELNSVIRFSNFEKDRLKFTDIINLKDFEKQRLDIAKTKLEPAYSKIKKIVENAATMILNGITTNSIYNRIDPHHIIKNVKINVEVKESDPELSILVENENDSIYPEWYFSSAQLNTVALSLFLGRALNLKNKPIDMILIDDPVGHFDDVNTLAFVDVIRSVIEQTESQVILSTHSDRIFELLKNKIPEQHYKSKYINLQEDFSKEVIGKV